MQHLPQVEAARRENGFDYSECFAAVLPRFRAADLTVVNLETTLTHSDRYTGYPMFRSPVALAEALAQAGVDIATMANNHCCDGGAGGIRTTIEVLDRCGICHTGVFADSLDRKLNHPLRIERHGVRFAFLSYTYGTNGLRVPRGTIVNPIDTTAWRSPCTGATNTSGSPMPCSAGWPVFCGGTVPILSSVIIPMLYNHARQTRRTWCSIRWAISSPTSGGATATAV